MGGGPLATAFFLAAASAPVTARAPQTATTTVSQRLPAMSFPPWTLVVMRDGGTLGTERRHLNTFSQIWPTWRACARDRASPERVARHLSLRWRDCLN